VTSKQELRFVILARWPELHAFQVARDTTGRLWSIESRHGDFFSGTSPTRDRTRVRVNQAGY